MISVLPQAEVLLYIDSTDMRKSFDGLAGLIQAMEMDPLDGTLYVFFNRRRDRLKILYWERGGYWLLCRRLEEGTFEVPLGEIGSGVVLKIDMVELAMILEGIGIGRLKKKRRFEIKNIDSRHVAMRD